MTANENEMDRGPEQFVWVVQTLEGAHPKIGTLAEYARDYEMASITGDHLLSSTMWAAREGDLVGAVVQVERGRTTEDCRIPFTYSVHGETVTYFADGAA